MFRVWVTAYSLMPNHYHLLIQTPEGNLTRCMRHVGGVYTQLFNRRHGHDGQLFKGRYKIRAAVCEAYSIKYDELDRSRRGVTNEPRNVAVYLSRILCGKTLPEIADLFNIRTYSTVSSILRRVNEQLVRDEAFKSNLECLKIEIMKSQRQT